MTIEFSVSYVDKKISKATTGRVVGTTKTPYGMRHVTTPTPATAARVEQMIANRIVTTIELWGLNTPERPLPLCIRYVCDVTIHRPPHDFTAPPVDRGQSGAVGAFRRTVVGRNDALAALAELWDGSVAGSGHGVALVFAPSGYGKTSLLHRFVSGVPGPLSLLATCEEDETAIAFGMLGSLLRPIEVPADSPLSTLRSGRPTDLDPLAAGAALLELFDQVGGDGLLIGVDDLHWSDQQSLRALVFALRRLWRSPVMTVLTCDQDWSGWRTSAARRLLDDADLQMTLGGLAVGDVAVLASELGVAPLSQAGAARIAEHSGGSPLYAMALLTELTASEVGDPVWPLRAPGSYADLVAVRLKDSGPEGSTLVEALAILGDSASLASTARLCGVKDPAAAFDQAVAAGLLTRGTPTTLEFDHPLTRSAVFHSMTLARRTELHRAAAQLLAATDAAGALDHRVAAATSTDPQLAADLGDYADRDADAGSWKSAGERYRVAASLSEPNSLAMAHFTLRMVECLALDGDPAALEIAEATLERFEQSALRSYALGRMRSLQGAWDDAETLLEESWQVVDSDTEPELASRICGELARVAIMGGQGATALDWIDRSLGFPSHDEGIQRDVMALWSVAMGIQGRSAEALEAMDHLPAPAGDPSPDELDRIAGQGMLRLWNGNVSQACADLATVVAKTRSRGPVFANLFASQYLADACYRLGDWDHAIVTAEDAVATARDLDFFWAVPMLHAVASYPHSARGNFETAQNHIAAAAEAASKDRSVPNRLWTVVAAARLSEAQRDADGVVTALAPMVELELLDGTREPGMQPWQPMLAAALAQLGDFDQARAILDEAEELAETRGHPVQTVAVLRERARIQLLAGDPERAIAMMEQAEKRAHAIADRPFEFARFELLRGELLRRIEHFQPAIAALEQAHLTFVSLGAAPWTADAVAELQRCGGGTSALGSGPDRLTPQQVRVARLVAQGLSDRDVATELVVSIKTVGFHLANVYRKLGVHSRVQMANALEEQLGERPSPEG